MHLKNDPTLVEYLANKREIEDDTASYLSVNTSELDIYSTEEHDGTALERYDQNCCNTTMVLMSYFVVG